MDFEQATTAEQASFDTSRLASLVEEIGWRLPGADGASVRKALQAAFRRFCMDSGAFVERVRVPAGPLGGCRAETSYHATVLRAEAFDAFGRPLPRPRVDARGATLPPGALGGCGMAEIALVLLPERDSEEAPDGFFERHGEAIVHAALTMLYAMKGRPWFDEGQVRQEDRLYHDALASAVAPDFPRTALPPRAGLW